MTSPLLQPQCHGKTFLDNDCWFQHKQRINTTLRYNQKQTQTKHRQGSSMIHTTEPQTPLPANTCRALLPLHQARRRRSVVRPLNIQLAQSLTQPERSFQSILFILLLISGITCSAAHDCVFLCTPSYLHYLRPRSQPRA